MFSEGLFGFSVLVSDGMEKMDGRVGEGFSRREFFVGFLV